MYRFFFKFIGLMIIKVISFHVLQFSLEGGEVMNIRKYLYNREWMFLYVLVEGIKNNLKLFNNTHVFEQPVNRIFRRNSSPSSADG